MADGSIVRFAALPLVFLEVADREILAGRTLRMLTTLIVMETVFHEAIAHSNQQSRTFVGFAAWRFSTL